ncbi:hypothetical protein PMIN05_001635 [Paraphaeosphaeria minitans]
MCSKYGCPTTLALSPWSTLCPPRTHVLTKIFTTPNAPAHTPYTPNPSSAPAPAPAPVSQHQPMRNINFIVVKTRSALLPHTPTYLPTYLSTYLPTPPYPA